MPRSVTSQPAASRPANSASYRRSELRRQSRARFTLGEWRRISQVPKAWPSDFTPSEGSSESATPRISYSRKIFGSSIQAKYSVRAGMGAMVVILGLGFTGARLARRLLLRGVLISAPVRGSGRFPELAHAGLQLSDLT